MNYPLFKSHGFGLYKVLSPELAVLVYPPNDFGRGDVGFTDVSSTISRVSNDGTTIPENTFIDAYVKAIHDINKEVNPDGLQVYDHQLSPGLENY